MRITDVMKANKALGITAHATGTIPELMAIKDSTPANVLGIATDTSAFVTYDGAGNAFVSYARGKPYEAGFSIGHNDFGQAYSVDYSASLPTNNGNYTLPVGSAGEIPKLRAPTQSVSARDLALAGASGKIYTPPMLANRIAYRDAGIANTVKISLIEKTLPANGLTAGQFLFILLILQEAGTGDWYQPHVNSVGNKIAMVSDGSLLQPSQSELQFDTGPSNIYLRLLDFDQMFFFCYVTEAGKSVSLGSNYNITSLLNFDIEIT